MEGNKPSLINFLFSFVVHMAVNIFESYLDKRITVSFWVRARKKHSITLRFVNKRI